MGCSSLLNRLKCVDQDFKLNSFRYWKPVKVFENSRNMVKPMSLENDTCCKVLDFLKSVQLSVWYTT